jgi:hypothetical protein
MPTWDKCKGTTKSETLLINSPSFSSGTNRNPESHAFFLIDLHFLSVDFPLFLVNKSIDLAVSPAKNSTWDQTSKYKKTQSNSNQIRWCSEPKTLYSRLSTTFLRAASIGSKSALPASNAKTAIDAAAYSG